VRALVGIYDVVTFTGSSSNDAVVFERVGQSEH
jgi:hypothetical protein